MTVEVTDTFECFGGRCTVLVMSEAPHAAVARARRLLLDWHDRFTRFDHTSELSRLNADPREAVPVGPEMATFVRAALDAAELTGGLVDASLATELEDRGYVADLGAPLDLETALREAPERRPAAPSPAARMRSVRVEGDVVHRPPGVRLDGGGIVKGLAADVLATDLAGSAAFAVDCAGDIRLGGLPRTVQVASPLDGSILHAFTLADAGVATSGISRRAWRDPDGRPAHHLLDPSTGAPAFTGILQATAIAPTAVEAEARAKAAVLGGPEGAAAHLVHGGVIVFDDGSHEVLGPHSGNPQEARPGSIP